jgi:hypothetical protein
VCPGPDSLDRGRWESPSMLVGCLSACLCWRTWRRPSSCASVLLPCYLLSLPGSAHALQASFAGSPVPDELLDQSVPRHHDKTHRPRTFGYTIQCALCSLQCGHQQAEDGFALPIWRDTLEGTLELANIHWSQRACARLALDYDRKRLAHGGQDPVRRREKPRRINASAVVYS